ncbi:MAG: hypothetical protein JXR94_10485, partial [Candidatus Hydrogenedentes bacterium]|nr:hypothetical protein [Candidatus Hydrogenedentota bacterium]
ERLLYGAAEERGGVLDELRGIVEGEMAHSTSMIALCEQNAFLGFHAEAEGYKYFPDKLRWRIELLNRLLDTEFVEAAEAIAAGQAPFPEQSGCALGPNRYDCPPAPGPLAADWQAAQDWGAAPAAPCEQSSLGLAWRERGGKSAPISEEPGAQWRAAHDSDAIYVRVECRVPASGGWRAALATVRLESSHLYPPRTFAVDAAGRRSTRLGWLVREAPWEAAAATDAGRTEFRLRIPLDAFDGEVDPARPMRVNVQVRFDAEGGGGRVTLSWAPFGPDRVQYRLGYGGNDAREMGWLWLV